MTLYNLGTAKGKIDIDTGDVNRAADNINSAGRGLVGFGAAAVGAFGYTIKVAADFEKEMSFVKAVTGATTEEIDRLSQAAIDLGKKGPFGPREVAAGFVDLAKAGLTAEEIIGGVGSAAINLAAAADIPLTQATETLVNTMRTFDVPASEAVRLVDLIAGAANASTIEVEDFANTMTYAGAAAAAIGVDVAEVSTAIAILGNRGIDGSKAGTALRRMFLELANPSKKVTDQLRELGIVTEDGTNQLFTAEGRLKSMAEVFQLLQDGTKGLNQQQSLAALNEIFGDRAISAALILEDQGQSGFDEIAAQIDKVSAADVAAERLNNLSGAISLLKSAVDSVLIGSGSPFLEGFKDVVLVIRDAVLWFGELPAPVQKFIGLAVVSIGLLSLLSGAFLLTVGTILKASIAFGQLGSSLRVASSAIGGISKLGGLGFLANPVFLVVAAVVALGVALYTLYQRSEAFRKFVDDLWQTMQAAWDGIITGFRELPAEFAKVWDKITSVFLAPIDYIGDRIRGFVLGFSAFKEAFNGNGITTGANKIVGVFERMGVAARAFVDFFKNLPREVGQALTSLPGIAEDAAGDLVSAFGRQLEKVPFIMGYIVGLTIGTLNRLVQQGPGIVARFGLRVIMEMDAFGRRLIGAALNIGKRVLDAVVFFIIMLPARLQAIFLLVLQEVVNAAITLGLAAYQLGQAIFNGIRDFIMGIPGMVGGFFIELYGVLNRFWTEAQAIASNIGLSIANGITDAIRDLPGLIVSILGDAVQGIYGMVSDAFSAARSFGNGLWQGFKDGMGINSPSFIEEALFDVENQAAATNRNLRSEVLRLQNAAKTIPQLNPLSRAPVVTPTGSGQGGDGMVVQGPLIENATIRNEKDAVTMARELNRLAQKQARAQGRQSVLVGVNG